MLYSKKNAQEIKSTKKKTAKKKTAKKKVPADKSRKTAAELDKPTASRAKILGRVELPAPAPRRGGRNRSAVTPWQAAAPARWLRVQRKGDSVVSL